LDQENDRIAILLSVNPTFAERILTGTKKVEFRRTKFRESVRYVVLYATAPVKRIVGFFEIEGIEEAPPCELWRRFNHKGNVEEHYFRSYYADSRWGYAIQVGHVYSLVTPIPLNELGGIPSPPQSFRYLESRTLHWLRDMSKMNG
jgi:predicted transcriptional regulator